MYVKRLDEKEVLDALRLAWEVFAEEVAPTYTSQGVEEFQNFIKYEGVITKVRSGELSFFAAIEGTQMCGMSAIRRDGHICLLFVQKKWQRQGVGRLLFYAMQQYCVLERRMVRMTVNAAPNAVEAYQHLGFTARAEEQVENGIRYVPMEYLIKEAGKIAGSVAPVRRGGRRTSAILAFLLGFFVVSSAAIGFYAGDFVADLEEMLESQEHITESGNGRYDYAERPEGETAEITGIEAIEAYIAEDLSYTIEEEEYTYYSDGNNKEYRMQFVVKYPQLKGLDSEKADEINQLLKECAMSTANVLYLNPSQETKEAMLQYDTPVLASQVTYKVTYATDGFLSVAFNDVYYAGDSSKGYVDFRTRNIDLESGTIYEVTDVAELTNSFMRDWKAKMDEEAPGVNVLNDLRTSDFRKILNGEVLDGSYFNAFFVDKDGVEIGFTYHHVSGDTMESGWITAPFTMAEMKNHNPESKLWNEIK